MSAKDSLFELTPAHLAGEFEERSRARRSRCPSLLSQRTVIPNEGRRSSPEQRRTLWMASLSTLLVLITFVTPLGTGIRTAATLQTGLGGQAWLLSSMSVGLAAALLAVGAAGRRLRTPAGVHRRPRPRRAGRRDGGGRRFDRCVRRGPRAAGRRGGRGAGVRPRPDRARVRGRPGPFPRGCRPGCQRGRRHGPRRAAHRRLRPRSRLADDVRGHGGARRRPRRRRADPPARARRAGRRSRRPPGHHSPGRRPDVPARRTGAEPGRLDPADDGGTPDRRPAAPGGFPGRGAALRLAAHRRPAVPRPRVRGRHPRGIRDRRRGHRIGLVPPPCCSAGSGTPSSSSPSGSSSGQR